MEIKVETYTENEEKPHFILYTDLSQEPEDGYCSDLLGFIRNDGLLDKLKEKGVYKFLSLVDGDIISRVTVTKEGTDLW
jgi:hypothetical protein